MKHLISQSQPAGNLTPCFSPLGTWSFSIGTSIGWGSLVVTCNAYLASAGILGTIIGLIVGMIVILVITRNLQYMIIRNPSAGGIYTFSKKICGHDYGFLAAWFLLLTYLAILWANVSSFPLFARYFLGDIFRFGFHYRIFGYEIYFGEILLSITAIILVGFLCANFRKTIQVLMIIFALLFVLGFSFCAVWALTHHGNAGYDYDPLFLPDSMPLAQIAHIAVISPWAFIGFENIAHFSEEYTFPVRRIRRILLATVILTTMVYLFVTMLSVSAYPPEYDSWLAYIRDMGNLSGIKAVPSFYAIYHYLGNTGVAILILALVGAVMTSLIGNLSALSRLLFAAGRDGDAPTNLKTLNAKGIPSRAILYIVIITALIPFLGRTAIGWIVDVTTLGTTIIYGLISYAVFHDARRENARTEQGTGLAGLILMIGFVIMLLMPNLLSFNTMASESYILFAIWAILGLIYFHRLIIKNQFLTFGKSIIVWIILLLLVLFASMMWVTRETQDATNDTMQEIHQYYEEHVTDGSLPENDEEYLLEKSSQISNVNSWFTIASFTIFIVSAFIIMTNYRVTQKREEEHFAQLSHVKNQAVTDALTGVKNRLAYAKNEEDLNKRIASGDIDGFAIVVCDVNNLKMINDRKGHSAGDECIRNNCQLICRTFKHSPVFRIGGDEFAVILEGEDYEKRADLLKLIEQKSLESIDTVGSTLSAGMSEYKKGIDRTVLSVFTRADQRMYRHKKEMKAAARAD